MRNVLFVISGPSGVGKGTIAKKLVERNSQFALSISCTTRSPRPGEKDGIDYFFISKQEFQNKIDNNGLLEYSNHFENFYGTPRQFVEEKLKTHDVLLEIDVNGGLKVKEEFPQALLIMILPPSIEEIRNRLIKRSTESIQKIDLRMQRIKYELEKKSLYDFSVVNDKLITAVEKIEEYIKLQKNI
ncbi:MAG: guanylate kinase [Clostridia bacterium]|nr:guanylate kinase [Clostridia bacterium]